MFCFLVLVVKDIHLLQRRIADLILYSGKHLHFGFLLQQASYSLVPANHTHERVCFSNQNNMNVMQETRLKCKHILPSIRYL